jgi:hypothetical protein
LTWDIKTLRKDTVGRHNFRKDALISRAMILYKHMHKEIKVTSNAACEFEHRSFYKFFG